ncbi:hypothetical protein AOL_s00173g189 [Orbilia oligospora ATCC 24927]|uniref:Uncharacterized protein n=1 Tax=Arthrobotrys oligospora (strain ATCC 24927 / CBS 115.81 / DSM 1491) TaxID=756982 RepID=G1XP21_ARTOA|nr:hypothetical protein AOL_s00173g189 [Orbilia oligospora ATCC 24927]EGX45088.1 hypothetical protein AOL_s00173g189 [Orbilia oligospora ATCC 24927]
MFFSVSIPKTFLILQLFFSLVSCQVRGSTSGYKPTYSPIHLAWLAKNQKDIRQQAAVQLKELREAQTSKGSQPEQLQREVTEDQEFLANSVIISKRTWEVFEEALQIAAEGPNGTLGESPVQILTEAAKSIAKLTIQIHTIGGYVKRILKLPESERKGLPGDKAYVQIFDKLMRTLQPVFNLYPGLKDKNDEEIISVIAKGGYIDQTWGASSLYFLAQLRKLLDYDELSRNTILVSDAPLRTAFRTIDRARSQMREYLFDMQAVLAKLQKKYPKEPFDLTLHYPEISPEGERRQDIGYHKYYEGRYIDKYTSRALGGITRDGVPVEEPFISWSKANELRFEMYFGIMELFDRIVAGNMSLMMEMIIDILLAANVFLGRRTSLPDYEFGLLLEMNPGLENWDAFSWMESYPEMEFGRATPRLATWDPPPAEFLLPQGQHDADPFAPQYLKFDNA